MPDTYCSRPASKTALRGQESRRGRNTKRRIGEKPGIKVTHLDVYYFLRCRATAIPTVVARMRPAPEAERASSGSWKATT
tara:strand:+ start:71 stop:310 length:240 start_codon:yes stop_codon:yes gene_type:complete